MSEVLIGGHGRQTIVATTALSVPGSNTLATFNANAYSRITGMFQVVGSATVVCQFGVNSGTYQVSSSFVVNSGPSAFDILNYGRTVNIYFSAANSQAGMAALILGEPIR